MSKRADDKRRSGAGNRVSTSTAARKGNGAGSPLGIFHDRRTTKNGKAVSASRSVLGKIH